METQETTTTQSILTKNQMTGECLCKICLYHWEAMQQLKIDNLIDMERGK